MKLAKLVSLGIATSVVGILCIGIGFAVAASEDAGNSTEIETETREGLEDFKELNDKSLQLSFDAANVKIHESKTNYTYISYSINGLSKVERENNLFKVEQKSGFSFYYWLHMVSANEVEIYLSKTEMQDYTVSLVMNSGTLKVDEGIELKKLVADFSAGEATFEGITVDTMDLEINAATVDVENLTTKSLSFDVNAGNLDLNINDPQNWYTFDVSINMGNMHMSPNDFEGKYSIIGDKMGYSVTGEVNAGNVNISFPKTK